MFHNKSQNYIRELLADIAKRKDDMLSKQIDSKKKAKTRKVWAKQKEKQAIWYAEKFGQSAEASKRHKSNSSWGNKESWPFGQDKSPGSDKKASSWQNSPEINKKASSGSPDWNDGRKVGSPGEKDGKRDSPNWQKGDSPGW